MGTNTVFPLSILTTNLLFLLASRNPAMAAIRCPNCGRDPVPYPLSTEPRCGDQSYKIRCSSGSLWLDALNHSSYEIISITPSTRRLILRTPGFANDDSCVSADFSSGGIWLNDSLPFNISQSNTIMKFNCSIFLQSKYEFCTSSSSVCHTYLTYSQKGTAACGNSDASLVCCTYSPFLDKPSSWYRIKVRKEKCSMYQSFVNLDPSLPVSEWPEPGVELQWAPPSEPLCNSPADCMDLLNSTCSLDHANIEQRRCFCDEGFQWDPTNVICQGTKRHPRKSWKLQKIARAFIGVAMAIVGSMLAGILFVIIIRKRRQPIRRVSHIRLGKALEHPNFQQQG